MVASCPGFAEGAFSRAGRGRAARGAAARRRATACACSTPAPRRAARPRTLPSWRTSTLPALDTRRGPAARASARISRGCNCSTAGVACAGRRRRRPGGLVGRRARSTASWPTCPAPRRASCAAIPTASGCGASRTSRPSALQQPRILDGAVAVARARRAPPVRDLLGVRGRKRLADQRLPAPATRTRCAKPSALPADCAARRRAALAFGERGKPQSGRLFLRAAAQGLSPLRAWRAAPERTPPRTLAAPFRRHAVRPPSSDVLRLRASPSRPGRGRPVRVAWRCSRRPARAATRSPCARPSCASRRARCCSTPNSTSRSTRRWRRRCRRASRCTSCSSSSSRAAAGTGSTRRSRRPSITYRVSYNALTQQYSRRSGLLAQSFNSLDEVERYIGRVTSRPVARRGGAGEGHALRRRAAPAPRREPAAQAVPGERARVARVDARLRLVPLELRAMTPRCAGRRCPEGRNAVGAALAACQRHARASRR